MERILVIGAGEAGRMVSREIATHPELGFTVTGFVDDDPAKRGTVIDGSTVLGGKAEIAVLVAREQVTLVIIAIPSAPGRVIRDIVSACRDCAVRVRIVPGIFEIIAGDVHLNNIRPIRVEDLLGRETVRVESAGLVRGKRVLVTGAAGSIGSELCRQILRGEPGELYALDNGETELFNLGQELGGHQGYVPVMGDIRDRQRMTAVFAAVEPHLVFHAAAYKHVPMMERAPGEAVKTNVFGTQAVVELAVAHGVERFVLISSDKAVNPTNVMGATKRLAERVVLAAAGGPTKCAVVRFGNVLASRGSVVPIFQAQIAAGGPLTVTHPDAVRYFMTIPEAAQLVIKAGGFGEHGEIFLLDMGDPIRIQDLARNLITLSGLRPDQDIEVTFSGLRPGEKLFEELLTSGEGIEPTAHPKIFRTAPEPLTENLVAGLAALAAAPTDRETLRLLRELVPEYRPTYIPV